ncbi:hypothetical protein [Janthinobacterium sp. HH106]|uniref:hypothetical protein n=1 Tax=Janthinobacterium sp. HH106 TaxID=1537278 RepID=UPI0011130854|nr:hypothetical protein [Janthinobacterium sp. HH106]
MFYLQAIPFCIFLAACSGTAGINRMKNTILLGEDSFALAARIGTPTSHHHQGDVLQLNYGSVAAGCQVIVLIDRQQRVAGWASAGRSCPAR